MYWTVSVETASLLAPWTIAETWDAGRPGWWLAQNEPSALETLTTAELLGDRESAGLVPGADVDGVPAATSWRAASLPRPLVAPVMSVVVMP